jgi:hypothetical protein
MTSELGSQYKSDSKLGEKHGWSPYSDRPSSDIMDNRHRQLNQLYPSPTDS